MIAECRREMKRAIMRIPSGAWGHEQYYIGLSSSSLLGEYLNMSLGITSTGSVLWSVMIWSGFLFLTFTILVIMLRFSYVLFSFAYFSIGLSWIRKYIFTKKLNLRSVYTLYHAFILIYFLLFFMQGQIVVRSNAAEFYFCLIYRLPFGLWKLCKYVFD